MIIVSYGRFHLAYGKKKAYEIENYRERRWRVEKIISNLKFSIDF